MELRLDDFNEGLLAGNRDLGVRSPRSVSFMVWALVLAGTAAGGYWGYREGHVHRLAETAISTVGGFVVQESAVAVVEPLPVRPITVREEGQAVAAAVERVEEPAMAGAHSESRERVLARLDQLETEAANRVERSQSVPELDRLRMELAKPAGKPMGEARGGGAAKTDRAERETPIIVARPAPAARQKPVSPVAVESVKPKLVEAPRATVAESPREKVEEDSSSIMLFRKRDAAPVVVERQAVARPIHPASPEPASAPARMEKPEISERAVAERAPEPGVPIRPPVLVVEEGGVRVIGPEGERFIPIGGKLNGKHILATSPKIGLIVTEDSAIRVHNQEKN